jgi:molybdopterin-guanine dinucleotide biosynthesis protein A
MSEPKTKMTAIILAGGNSVRMGENKAFIQIDGIPIITRIQSLFKELSEEVIIVTNQKDLFKNFDSNTYTDLLPDRGALGGLYTGIFFSSYPYSFCVACDMPFLKRSLVQFLIRHTKDEDALVPRTRDGLQPLHAIYSKRCLDAIKKVMDQGKNKIIDFYDLVRVKIVEERDFLHLDTLRESFVNVNTPEDLLLIRKAKESKRE